MLVSYSYYTDTFLGAGVSQEEFPRLESRAEDLLNEVTRKALDKYASLPADVQEVIQKAICYQVDYYNLYGLQVGYAEEERGFTVGKVSVQAGGIAAGVKTYVCPMALGLLENAGLMSRSVGVIC